MYSDDILVSESGYKNNNADKCFDQKYVTIFNFKTVKKYRGNGYGSYLLKNIFKYVSNVLVIKNNIINSIKR